MQVRLRAPRIGAARKCGIISATRRCLPELARARVDEAALPPARRDERVIEREELSSVRARRARSGGPRARRTTKRSLKSRCDTIHGSSPRRARRRRDRRRPRRAGSRSSRGGAAAPARFDAWAPRRASRASSGGTITSEPKSTHASANGARRLPRLERGPTRAARDRCRRARGGWARTSSIARGVGTMPCGVRTRSGSPSSLRSRPSAWLIAGCVSPTRSAARVTLPSATSASRRRAG